MLNLEEMTSKELLKEIESWLSFNTEPSREETAKLRKSIKDHLTEQLRLHDVVGQSEQLNCDCCNGTGMVEGDYRDELESCLTCNGRGTF